MSKASGFIALHRQILDWEWYGDINTFRLFLHILLTANFTEGRFEGRTIHRGQLVTSLTSLSTSTALSVRQVRDSLNKLKTTGELTSETTNRYRIITVVKYDQYQLSDKQNGKQMTSETAGKRQANDKQNDKQNGNNIINTNNNIKREQGNNKKEGEPAKRFSPPSPEEVRAFASEAGLQVDADRFCDYYASKGWRVGNQPMKDWRAAARNWARRESEPAKVPVKQMPAQNFEQRDYADYDPMAELAKEIAAMKGGTL